MALFILGSSRDGEGDGDTEECKGPHGDGDETHDGDGDLDGDGDVDGATIVDDGRKASDTITRASPSPSPSVPPPWLERARRELIFSASSPSGALAAMVAATCKYLGAADAAGLETLHLLGGSLPDTPVPLSPTLIHAYRHGGHKLPITWRRARRDQKKMIQRLTRDPDYMAYEAAYKRFVSDSAAPPSRQVLYSWVLRTVRVRERPAKQVQRLEARGVGGAQVLARRGHHVGQRARGR